jgi:Aspartyl protease
LAFSLKDSGRSAVLFRHVQTLGCFAAFCVAGSVAAAQEISMPFQLQDNLIRVPILINGSKADAVLDSGTGALGVDRTFALSLGLRPGEENGKIPGGGAAVPMFPINLSKIEFGPERLSHIAGVAFDMGHLSSSAGFPVQVLLGQPAFQSQTLRIDYPDRKIVFLATGMEAACSDPIPLTFVGGTPVVTVTLQTTPTSAPQTLHLIIDLGTRQYAAMIGGSFLDTPDGKELEKAGKPAQVGTGTGGAVMGNVAQVSSLVLGRHQFPALRVALTRNVGAYSSGIADGALGVPLWVAGTITFDYPHQRLCLDVPKNRETIQ